MIPPRVRTFNRVLRRFADDLERPEYAAGVAAVRDVVARARAAGVELRLDALRDWENAQILLGIGQIGAGRGALEILDVGGGNAPTASLLAEAGHAVTVMDVDPVAVHGVELAADALGLGERLRAVEGGEASRAWPFRAASFDLIVSISVLEGVLRSRRAAWFREAARVLRPRGDLLLTFDFGEGARFVSDAPTSAEEVERSFVAATPFERVGEPFEVPTWDPEIGPPVKIVVPRADGFDLRVAEYSFASLHLRKA